MAKSFGQRLKLFYLLDYLLENTDENHTVGASEISEHLERKYGIPVERKTIYTDIALLKEYGEAENRTLEMDYDTQKRGYNVFNRDFELYELQLLVDCILSSKFITQQKAKEITDKLKRLTSRHNRQTLERRSYVVNRIRSENDSIFNFVDSIHEAIANDCKITFQYFEYSHEKEKVFKNKAGIYEASPFALMWNDDNYYLVAFEKNKIKHFRVDKMEKISIIEEMREGKEIFKQLNLEERRIRVFSMFSGKEENVKLRFINNLADVIIDRFGKDIIIMPDDETHSIINVTVETSPTFYGWLCNFGRKIKILSPAHVVENMAKHVAAIASMYQDIETDTKK